jgi:hypothetical protein
MAFGPTNAPGSMFNLIVTAPGSIAQTFTAENSGYLAAINLMTVSQDNQYVAINDHD